MKILRPYQLGIYPVTLEEYRRITGEIPNAFKDCDRNPVESVSWLNAVEFCNRLSQQHGVRPFYVVNGEEVSIRDREGTGFRLPTEAEWEFACRAGTTTRWFFGDDPNELGRHVHLLLDDTTEPSTQAVGELRGNQFQLHDMCGNVWEWVWDGYDSRRYQNDSNRSQSVEDPGWKTKVSRRERVLRGESFREISVVTEKSGPRCTARWHGHETDTRADNIGFRLARTCRC